MGDLDRQLLELAGSNNPARRNQLLIDTDDPDRVRRPERLRKLIRAGADINVTDGFDGAGLVHILAQMGDIPALDTAIELGANPDARDREGQTALHVVAESQNIEVLCRLLDLGIDPNARSHGEETPLHDWAYRGNPGGVRELLDRGADPDVRRDDGMTPLHLAALAGAADNVRTLLDRDANPSLTNDVGATPLDVAREHHRWEVAKILSDRTGEDAVESSDDEPRAQLRALARKLGLEAARIAIDTGDWEAQLDDDLDPTDLADDYWESNHAFVVEDAYDRLSPTEDLPPRRAMLDELFAAYYQAFVEASPSL